MAFTFKKIRRKAFGWAKLRLIQWIAISLEQHNRGIIHASVASTAVIAPEADLENLSDDADNIRIGEHTFVRGKLLTFAQGGAIRVGEHCYIGHRTEIWSMNSVSIGDRVLISHNVSITDNTAHSMNAEERHAHHIRSINGTVPQSWKELPGISASPIVIEDDVWINFGVTILKGVRIGAGSVIAAGSMVTKDVPPGVLYRCEIKPVITPLDEAQASRTVRELARQAEIQQL